ncbi:MAG: hypothetical protein Q8N05_19995 [Bacteroidota bacterium]|nr:hypothetical protein [Bacteroidota bacterium]
MKNYIPNPHSLLMGFFVLIVFSSGSSLKAQEKKRLSQSIIINNGDTIINGRKLSEANKEEQIRLRKEFKEMEGSLKMAGEPNEQRVIIRRNNGKDSEIIIRGTEKQPLVLNWDDGKVRNRNFDDKWPDGVQVYKFNGDSLMLSMRDTLMKGFPFALDSNLRKRIISMHRDLDMRTPGAGRRMLPPMTFERSEFPDFRERSNSSSFNYNYTDKDGISSRMNIRISDAEKDKLKKITGSDSDPADLDIKDLTLFPNFSNGKTGLSFNLESRGTTRVRILDSDLKQVFSDEAASFNGNYMKQVSLPKNGIYYITVSQNANWFVRKLIKD